jgi:two-component system heavy metal sensor histidine kinase CusS
MFWKSGDIHQGDQRSLSTKLMILYTLSTLSIFCAVCLFLYPTFLVLISHLGGNYPQDIKKLCYKNIIIALLFSALGAIALGKLVAKNGLNRLREFSDKIKKISADSLHDRIHLEDWPNELKGLGVEFNLMLDRIQTSFVQLTQFSSDIAHELRGPLNNLQGITEIALSKENLPIEYSRVLESYINEYQHLTKLVESLLFLARSDQRQLILKKQLVHAQAEVLKLIEYYQLVAEENKIQVICEGDARLLVDATLFKRVINNVLSNALKYTPENGKINISIKSLDEEWVEISMHDTGIGIDEKHLPSIFDRFYRVDSSRSAESGGLGLGLAIVKSIVELHGGKVKIVSQPDRGTSLSLFFPQAY